ncbi:NAD(P)/FAD-dependent oxidoreductase [Streptacidiphilus griseoplanus]|uniref:NAD(P)/FAD-dependent oxidoreductase n=1 Tax=Peterkaempfera griseoplana TaxID=66896 RepID=UPI001FDFB0B1|nr:FAD-binding oxidoreductase [Peterkaempfera griseoplana]
MVGGGVAGSFLARCLYGSASGADITVFTGGTPADATGASGGMVRGFETGLDECRTAAQSMAELRADPWLSEAARYRETGSTYLLPPGADPADQVKLLEELLPGSAEVLPGGAAAARLGLHGIPPGTLAVVERLAGHISPDQVRTAVLRRLADNGVPVLPTRVRGVTEQAGVLLPDGALHRFDLVVVAAGGWTPALLPEPSGLFRTKRIQYGTYRPDRPVPGVFVDDNSGLYGRPLDGGGLLLGLGSEEWDVSPDAVPPDLALAERVAAAGAGLLQVPPESLRPDRLVASFDCYAPSGGLRLRTVPRTRGVFTFTGGSGGAAKTAPAASRAAAAELLDLATG